MKNTFHKDIPFINENISFLEDIRTLYFKHRTHFTPNSCNEAYITKQNNSLLTNNTKDDLKKLFIEITYNSEMLHNTGI
jgi:hypothetical protein